MSYVKNKTLADSQLRCYNPSTFPLPFFHGYQTHTGFNSNLDSPILGKAMFPIKNEEDHLTCKEILVELLM